MYSILTLIDRILLPVRMLVSVIGRCTPGAAAIGKASPPLQAALAWFLLVLTTAIALVIFVNPFSPPPEFSTVRFWALLVCLVVLTPVMVYWGVRLLLSPAQSRFPDIDEAWIEGLRALKGAGFDLRRTPVVLVLGSCEEPELRAAFMHSNVVLDGVTGVSSPLRWFAIDDPTNGRAIYLCCPGATVFSDSTGVSGAAGATPRGGPSAQGKRTATVPGVVGGPRLNQPARAPLAIPSRGGARRTCDFIDIIGNKPGAPQHRQAAPPPPGQDERSRRRMQARLRHVCRRLRSERAPIVPLNGVLHLVPFETVLHHGEAYVGPALEEDTQAVLGGAELRCGAVVMITRLHEETGFLEMTRRLGEHLDPALNRFGAGFPTAFAPLKDRIEAASYQACGSFEDFAYALYRQPSALASPTNGDIYATACKFRGRFRRMLTPALLRGFGIETDRRTGSTAPGRLKFAGCYFTATGDTEDRHAWVKSVVEDRFLSHPGGCAGDIEWTTKSDANDEWLRLLANLSLLLAMLFVVGAVVKVAYSNGT